jgi:hypothetical protein
MLENRIWPPECLEPQDRQNIAEHVQSQAREKKMPAAKCFLRNIAHGYGMFPDAHARSMDSIGEILPIGQDVPITAGVRAWLDEAFVATHWKRCNPWVWQRCPPDLWTPELGVLP